jgi:hypothetical protein
LAKQRVEAKTGKIIIEIGVLLLVLNFLCATGVWQSILNEWKVLGDGTLFVKGYITAENRLLFTTADRNTCYVGFLWLMFSFLGNKEAVVLWANLFLLVVGVLFFYLGTRRLAGWIPALVTAAGMGITGSLLYNVTLDTSLHLLWFSLAALFWLVALVAEPGQETGTFLRYGDTLLVGLLAGVGVYVDLLAAGIVLLYFLALFLRQFPREENPGNAKEGVSLPKKRGVRIRQSLVFILGLALGFFLMLTLWEETVYGEGVAAAFFKWWYSRLTLGQEMIGTPQCILYAVFFIYICLLLFILHIQGRKKQENAEPPTETASVQEKTGETEVIAETKAVTEAEAVAEKTVAEAEPEPASKVQYIENPLPLPKKHVKKEMDYAFEPAPEQMHYDLQNYDVNDDYDLK